MSTPQPELLPCGRDPVTVWDRATRAVAGTADGGAEDVEDRHERGCPYCQAVIAEYLLLARATRTYLQQTITPPAELVSNVMRVVLTELRPGRPVPLPVPPELGAATITATALAGALRALLDTDPTVLVHSCRVGPTRPDAADDASSPSPRLTVQLSLAISYDHFHRRGDAAVRQRVITAARQLCGLTVTTVDVEVVDVFTDADMQADADLEADAASDSQLSSAGTERHPEVTLPAPDSTAAGHRDPSSAATVRYSEHALARIAAHVARTAPGIARLHPRLGRWALTAARRVLAEPLTNSAELSAVQIARADEVTTIDLRLAVRLDPGPLHTVTALLAAERAALAPLLPGPLEIRATVVDVEP